MQPEKEFIVACAIRTLASSGLYDKCSMLENGSVIRMMDTNPVEYAESMMLDKNGVVKIDNALSLAASSGKGSICVAIAGDYGEGKSIVYYQKAKKHLSEPRDDVYVDLPGHKFDAVFYDPNRIMAPLTTGILILWSEIENSTSSQIASKVAMRLNLSKDWE